MCTLSVNDVNYHTFSHGAASFTKGIISFSRLGGFCANLGSAEIFLATKERGPQNKW